MGIQIGSPIRDIAAANPASNLATAGSCADVGSTSIKGNPVFCVEIEDWLLQLLALNFINEDLFVQA